MSSDFVTVKQAAERFGKSEKTIYRLIDRTTSKPTHSDRHYIKPTLEEVAALTRQRKKIKYAISVDLLMQRFGQPKDNHSTSHPGTEQAKESTAINALYEQRLADLKEQLKQAHQREKELKAESLAREANLLDYAQADKQLFAKANENLTQVLALPGITEATKAQNKTMESPVSPGQGIVPADIVDTAPRVEHDKAKPKTENPKQRKKSPAKTKRPAKEEPTTFAQRVRRLLLGSK